MPVPGTALAVCTIFLSIVLLLGASGRAAADGCLEGPNRTAPFGEKWYYRSDRDKNRKCWHLGPGAPFAILPPLPRTERAVNSAVAPLVRGLGSLFRAPMPHEAVAGEPRIVQSDATKPLTIEDIAAQRSEFPEERGETPPSSAFTPAQRKALFEEYLKWEQEQRGAVRTRAALVPVRSR